VDLLLVGLQRSRIGPTIKPGATRRKYGINVRPVCESTGSTAIVVETRMPPPTTTEPAGDEAAITSQSEYVPFAKRSTVVVILCTCCWSW
jgi:hypothetical protein